ncbi:bifunctional 4-hydroxy-2-oxoglutarate aldolase/2-dehydro-3-deoxy-phosphogluconate aldolase [Sediminitomix flava]|uniref:2-dehydro-3-deoxyphosphogluconate aldolase/(4S)-4-hydroxy-2-oxoglutarate aldolase n=1 Tax=Sediminitomix flava TaxID=379075 RepID=A0A315ZHI2_SEDFL|nr:bifunctional 4-hydroxy-2-oxoglutarate aldolase/2-dehydro-3-deoxy-phosphogluconate aldolase [Sediminitomix flava]PWJ44752.1 2-dehydro-3-deoxyphosphogluconate aldolase/(4S)-4-hydroxy-2-oxoglutarate aldolase [Sediminitomix flava]
MARFSRIEVALESYNTVVIPVFYHSDVEVCKKILSACYEGGVRVFEFTNRGEAAHIIFKELLDYAKESCPEMILGIGSVVDAPTAGLYIQLGANFIVSPILNQDIAKVCNRRKVSWMPGCGSLTEISQAEELGAEIVKIFPAKQVGGVEFIKAAKAPCPWSSIMPTGGITLDPSELVEFLTAGAHCIGMGSQLFKKNTDGAFDYAKITEATLSAIEVCQVFRENKALSV